MYYIFGGLLLLIGVLYKKNRTLNEKIDDLQRCFNRHVEDITGNIFDINVSLRTVDDKFHILAKHLGFEWVEEPRKYILKKPKK